MLSIIVILIFGIGDVSDAFKQSPMNSFDITTFRLLLSINPTWEVCFHTTKLNPASTFSCPFRIAEISSSYWIYRTDSGGNRGTDILFMYI
ncbi:hypothetical protein F4860DRAFT_198389 [Xylaria cubensis]|nr:hypothetical protein F4860DRAFT_198389 [Xylaria cubensis]